MPEEREFQEMQSGESTVYHDGHPDSERWARNTGEAVDQVIDEARASLTARGIEVDRLMMVVSKDIDDGIVNALGAYPITEEPSSARHIVEMMVDGLVGFIRGHYEGQPHSIATKIIALKASTEGVKLSDPFGPKREPSKADWKQSTGKANEVLVREIAALPEQVTDIPEVVLAHERMNLAMDGPAGFDISAGCREVGLNPNALAHMARAYMTAGHPEATGNGSVLHAAGITSGFLLGVAFQQAREEKARESA